MVDCLRGIAILLVLIGHIQIFPSQIHKFIYGFHMPLFFMIAGFLFRQDRPFPELIHRIALRYIFPYFILCGINLLIEIIMHSVVGMDYDIPNFVRGIIYSRGTVECMPNCTPLWFLTALSSGLVIYFWITRIHSRIAALFAVVLCGLVSLALDKYECPKLFWNIDSALMGIVFIASGHIIRANNLLGKFEAFSHAKQISLLVIMFSAGTAAIMLNYRNVNFDNNRYGNAVLMLIGGLSVSSGLFCSAKVIFSQSAGFLGYLGQHTLFIMSFDYFSNRIAKYSLEFIGLYTWPAVLCVKLAVIMTGLMLWNMLIKRIPDDRYRKLLSF
ncbi:MAG: acyltransferase family protein [Synergistaceae bacterium]|nr:acyltransferase family protein [Synergistaceae bacterium]